MKEKNIFTFLLTLSILLIFNQDLIAQPSIKWQKNYGGSGPDEAYSVRQTNDGGYIIAGTTISNDGDVGGTFGYADYWIIKLDGGGNLEWKKNYGGAEPDIAFSIEQTNDNGYIVVGFSESNQGNVGGNNGDADYWIVKLNANGNIEWEKNYGGTQWDFAQSVKQIFDGGYIIAGSSSSDNGDVGGNNGNYDYWIVKLNAVGNLEWEQNYGGTQFDLANVVQQTNDGGYIVAGHSRSNSANSSDDYWILKLDTNGNLEWEKNYGGLYCEVAKSIQQTLDGGYIVAGFTDGSGGDVSNNNGDNDYWIIKLDLNGNLEWEKNYGGTSDDKANSIKQTNDGGYIVVGYSGSNDDDINDNYGFYDYWIVKLDDFGNIEWEQNYGGTDRDEPNSMMLTDDGGYIVAGFSYSNDGDLTGNYGNNDFWVVKLESTNCSSTLQNTPQVNVQQSDVYIEDACYGIILTATDGSCYRVTVQVGGALVTEAIDCP